MVFWSSIKVNSAFSDDNVPPISHPTFAMETHLKISRSYEYSLDQLIRFTHSPLYRDSITKIARWHFFLVRKREEKAFNINRRAYVNQQLDFETII